MLLVVGLGNPGGGYESHRHNVGFMVVDRLAAIASRSSRVPPFRSKFSGEMCKLQLDDDDALLLKPMTYMNLSGDSVQPCAAFFKVPSEDVIVVHDELDLPFGEIRLKKGGGHGGHNGLRSIIGRMGPDFVRVRVGIGRPPADFRGDVADFVLSPFRSEEREEKLDKTLEAAAKSVLDIAARGLAAAMKTRNRRKKKAKPKKPPPPPPDVPPPPPPDVPPPPPPGSSPPGLPVLLVSSPPAPQEAKPNTSPKNKLIRSPVYVGEEE